MTEVQSSQKHSIQQLMKISSIGGTICLTNFWPNIRKENNLSSPSKKETNPLDKL